MDSITLMGNNSCQMSSGSVSCSSNTTQCINVKRDLIIKVTFLKTLQSGKVRK